MSNRVYQYVNGNDDQTTTGSTSSTSAIVMGTVIGMESGKLKDEDEQAVQYIFVNI